MSDESEILSLLRKIREEVEATRKNLREGLNDLRFRISSLERNLAGVRVDLAHMRGAR